MTSGVFMPISADEARARLDSLPPRPTEEQVKAAERGVASADVQLVTQLEEMMMSAGQGSSGGAAIDAQVVLKQQEELASVLRSRSLIAKQPYLQILHLEQEHRSLLGIVQAAEQAAALAGQGGQQPGRLSAPVCVEATLLEGVKGAMEQGVKEMDLCAKRMRFLPESVGRVTSLTALDISQNQLEVLPDAIGGLLALERLSVRSNKLTALPDALAWLSSLTWLDFSANKVKMLPRSLGKCSSLVVVNGSLNEITELPVSFCSSLTNLQSLSLAYNKVGQVPQSVSSLCSLTQLNLRFNRVSEISPTIGSLSQLRSLDLSNNFSDLTHLPISVAYLSSLEDLDVSCNQLEELPLEMHRMTSLKRLALEGNPWRVPPLEIVEQAKGDVEVLRSALAAEYARREAAGRSASISELIQWLAVAMGSWVNTLMIGGPGEGGMGANARLTSSQPSEGAVAIDMVRLQPLDGPGNHRMAALNEDDVLIQVGQGRGGNERGVQRDMSE